MLAQITYSLRQFSRDTFSSLNIRNFRLYYIGQIISTSGTFMQSIAQSWLVLQLTNSAAALGIVTALQYGPILFLGPYGGVIADRFPKRKILYVTQSAAGILALILGVLVAKGLATLWMVYFLAFCLGLINAFDNPTRQTFIIEMVGEDQLRNAVTLFSSLVNISRVIGPAIAGVLIVKIGLAPCFILNGISYGAVVIMLAMMRLSEMHVTPPLPHAKGQLKAGISYVISTPVLGDVLVMLAIVGTFTFEFQITLPIMAQFTFNGNASSYAFLTATMGLGAGIGGILIASRKNAVPYKLVGAALLFGLAVLGAALMPTLALSGLVMVLVGVSSIYFTSLGNSVLQLESSASDARAGDVFLVYRFPGLYNHRRAVGRLVFRDCRASLGIGLRRDRCTGSRRVWRADVA